jgi:hypothetical protein
MLQLLSKRQYPRRKARHWRIGMSESPARLINLNQAADLAPHVSGKKPSISTVWRWAMQGVGGIKLRTVRAGRRVATTETWVHEFFEALDTAARERYDTPGPSIPRPTRAGTRERQKADAREVLAKHGISAP